MNQSVDPCQDFYQFACGGFLDSTIIPEDKSNVDLYTPIEDRVQQQLRTIISKERPTTDPKYFQLPNTFFKACMNTTLINDLGATPLTNISKSLGGWPVLLGNSWDPNNTWSWEGAVKNFRSLGFSINYIMYFYIGVRYTDSTKNIIVLDESELAIDQDYLIGGLNDPIVSAYHDYMVDVAVLLGADRDIAKKELTESLQFEINLANISLSSTERENLTLLDNTRTLKQVQETWPFINWVEYVNSLLQTGLTIDENEEVSVTSIKFMNNIGKLLANTPKRTIANYLMWRIHAASLKFLSEPFSTRAAQFDDVQSGRQEQLARWKKCINEVNDE